MWIAVVIVGIVVLGLAAYAALGNLGEMPGDPVTDSPLGRVPDGPVDAGFLTSAVLPRRLNGYGRAEVDAYLASVVAGEAEPPARVTFPVAFGGYAMAVVDEILERVERQLRGEQQAERPSDAVPGPRPEGGPAPAPADAAEAGASPEDGAGGAQEP